MTNQGKLNLKCFSQSRRSTGSSQLLALVPILKTKDWSMSLPIKWLYMILIIVPIWLSIRLLKFDQHYWSLLFILQEILGFSIPREPQKSSEKLVLSSILIAFSIYSSTLFAILTGVKMTKESELKIDTLKDLNTSDFIPMMQKNYFLLLKRTNDIVIASLLQKSRIVSKDGECLDILLKKMLLASLLNQWSWWCLRNIKMQMVIFWWK